MTEIMPFPENNILFYWAAPQGCLFYLVRMTGLEPARSRSGT